MLRTIRHRKYIREHFRNIHYRIPVMERIFRNWHLPIRLRRRNNRVRGILRSNNPFRCGCKWVPRTDSDHQLPVDLANPIGKSRFH